MADLSELPGYRAVIAAQYDERYRGRTPQDALARRRALAPYLARVLDALALPDEGWLLDVGCGDGLCALEAAHARPGMTVVGVDASPTALALAAATARAEGVRNASFLEGDALAPPEAEFDRVGALSVLNLVPEKSAALAAWAKVARRGARLVVADGIALAGGVRDGPGPVTEARLVALARGAGWRLVHQDDVTALVAKLDAQGAWAWPEYVRPGIRYRVVAFERT